MPNDWTEEDSLDDDTFLIADHDEDGPPDDVCGCEDHNDMYEDD
ncbi:MAG: hypothetical protein RRY29_01615 [Desulfovibrionaceae bacterium]